MGVLAAVLIALFCMFAGLAVGWTLGFSHCLALDSEEEEEEPLWIG